MANPFAIGFRAARANLVPGLIIQALMVAMVLAYYFFPPSRAAFQFLAAAKGRWGYAFSFTSAVIAGAVLPVIFKITILQRGRVIRADFADLLFLAVFWGMDGTILDGFYRLQAHIFGAGADFSIVLKKVLVDQFIYNPVFAAPYTVICYEIKRQGYRLGASRHVFTAEFYRTHTIPTLCATWTIWIPVTTRHLYPPLAAPDPALRPGPHLLGADARLHHLAARRGPGRLRPRSRNRSADDLFFFAPGSPIPILDPPAMSPNDVFIQMPESTCAALLADLHENEKPLYKNLIENLAKQRKLRPVFVERKPRAERFAWIKDALGRKQNEPVAANLLQIWLVSRHPAMLCDFLDSLGIEHDDNGTVSQMPPQPEKAGARKGRRRPPRQIRHPRSWRSICTPSRRWMKRAGRCSMRSSQRTLGCNWGPP